MGATQPSQSQPLMAQQIIIRQAIDELRVVPNDPATIDAYNIYLSIFVLRKFISSNNNYGMMIHSLSYLFTVGSIALITVCLFQLNEQIAVVILIWAIGTFGYLLGMAYLKSRENKEDEQMLGEIERRLLTIFESRKLAFGSQAQLYYQQEELPQP